MLERETGLSVKPDAGLDSALLQKSAGPATCAIFTATKKPENIGDGVIRIGALIGGQVFPSNALDFDTTCM